MSLGQVMELKEVESYIKAQIDANDEEMKKLAGVVEGLFTSLDKVQGILKRLEAEAFQKSVEGSGKARLGN